MAAQAMNKTELLRALSVADDDEPGVVCLRLDSLPSGKLPAPVTDADLHIIGSAPEFKGVTKVQLMRPAASRMAALGGLPELKELFVSDGNIDLQSLSNCRGLTSLRLQSCTGFENLAAVAGVVGLEELEISFSHGLRSLEGAQQLTQLRKLSVAACQDLGDISAIAGATALQEVLLDVTRSKIATLAALGQLPNLTFVNVGLPGDRRGEAMLRELVRFRAARRDVHWHITQDGVPR